MSCNAEQGVRIHLLSICAAAVLAVAIPAVAPLASAQNIDMDEIRAGELFRWGVEAFHEGFFGKAILSFEKALSLDPQSARTRFWLARAFYKSGLEEQALNEWRNLMESGQATSLLQNWIQFVSYGRAPAEELEQENRYVVSMEIDSTDYYPFKRPTSVRARPDGSFYIVAFGSNEVLQIDGNSRIERILNGGVEGFDHPYDILEVADGHLFVSEFSANRITKLAPSGARLLSFGGRGIAPGKLLGPQFLASDGDGYIYVSDYGNRRVSKYDYEGNFILSFGAETFRFDGFVEPTGVAVLGDHVFVADRHHRDIFRFDTSGNFLDSIAPGSVGSAAGGEPELRRPEALSAVDGTRLIVADADRVLEVDVGRRTVGVLGAIGGGSDTIMGATLGANRSLVAADFDASSFFFLSRMADLYTGYFVKVERVDSDRFPEIVVDVSVTDRQGRPVVGLKAGNFRLTELSTAVEQQELVSSMGRRGEPRVALLVEKSQEMSRSWSGVEEAVSGLFSVLGGGTGLKTLSAGREPVVDTTFGETRLRTLRALQRSGFFEDWSWGAGVRLAATELIPSRGRKAVVYLSRGGIGRRPYADMSLMELAQLLRNNHIVFHAVYLDGDRPHPDIEFLRESTGGRSFDFFSPRGIGDLRSVISEQAPPVYVLRYTSPSDSDFGRRYIPLEAGVNLRKRSGYDECGYYAPLEY